MFQLPEEPDIGPMLRAMREDYGCTREALAEKIGMALSTLKYLEAKSKISKPRLKNGVLRQPQQQHTYERHGAGVKLISIRNYLRAFGLELVIATTSEFRPVYDKVRTKRFTKLTNRQKAIADLWVSGQPKTEIAKTLGISHRIVWTSLERPSVAAYVNAVKQESLDAAVLSWGNILIEQAHVVEELHVEKVRRKAQKVHEDSVKQWPQRRRGGRQNERKE